MAGYQEKKSQILSLLFIPTQDITMQISLIKKYLESVHLYTVILIIKLIIYFIH